MKIVVIGSGFAGLEVVREACKKPSNKVTLVDRSNHHLFQPLLYQVASAAVSITDISSPLRCEFGDHKNVSVILDELVDVDARKKVAHLKLSSLSYDVLVLACGSSTSFFGHDNWSEHAYSLKTLQNAREIRNRILTSREVSSHLSKNEENSTRRFVIVGGGPTGVEMAGSLCELTERRGDEERSPREIDVVLLEKGPRLLPSFSEKLSDKAKEILEEIGVSVILDAEVTGIDQGGVDLQSGMRIESRCIVWAAGVEAPPVNENLSFLKSKDGRIKVDLGLRVLGHSDIYCLGDQAYCLDGNNKTLPGLAAVAKQQGRYLGKKLRGKKQGKFKYRDFGQMATIGMNKAVVDFGFVGFGGRFAWFIWSLVHIFMLVGFRNKVSVFLKWIWSYLLFKPSAEVIDQDIQFRDFQSESLNVFNLKSGS